MWPDHSVPQENDCEGTSIRRRKVLWSAFYRVPPIALLGLVSSLGTYMGFSLQNPQISKMNPGAYLFFAVKHPSPWINNKGSFYFPSNSLYNIRSQQPIIHFINWTYQSSVCALRVQIPETLSPTYLWSRTSHSQLSQSPDGWLR